MSTAYEEGYALARAGRLTEAAERLENAYRAQPNHVFAGACLGHIWYELGRREEAIELYREVKKRVEARSARFSSLPETEGRMLALVAKRLREADAGVFRQLIEGYLADSGQPTSVVSRLLVSAQLLAVGARPPESTPQCHPELLHLSGIVEQAFHSVTEFPEMAAFREHHSEIRAEVVRQWLEPGLAAPYIQYHPGTVAAEDWKDLNHSANWSVIHLYKNGERVQESSDRFPKLMEALERLPLQRIPGFAPNAMLSVLQPRTQIKRHCGSMNGRLIAHYPLVVPPHCGHLTVAGESRGWEEGQWIVFDDSLIHSAINQSDAPRLVLIVDLWHPVLNDHERACIALFLQHLRKVSAPQLNV